MPNYTREIIKRFYGDQNLAAQYLGFSRKLLGELADCTGDIDYVQRRVVLPDGVKITVGFYAGMARVMIDVRNVTEKSAQEGFVIARCNGPHVYIYYSESLKPSKMKRGGPVYVADQPNNYWPDAPEGFKNDFSDDLRGANVTTRLLTLKTGETRPGNCGEYFHFWYYFNAVDGFPVVLPATPVVIGMSNGRVQIATIGIQTNGLSNASSCISRYDNSTKNGKHRTGREWELDWYRMSSGVCYALNKGASGFTTPVAKGTDGPTNRGCPGYPVTEMWGFGSGVFNSVRKSSKSIRVMVYDSYITYPLVKLLYSDTYTEEVPEVNLYVKTPPSGGGRVSWG